MKGLRDMPTAPKFAKPYSLLACIARCVFSSFVNAIISIDCKTKTVRICVLCKPRTLVIFSMVLTDLSRGSISRRVAVFQAF